MTTQINLDVLKSFKADLYDAVIKHLSLGPITGIVEVSKLQWFGFPEDVRKRLVEFLRLQSAPMAHDSKTCGCNDCFQKRVSEDNAKEKKRLEVDARIKAADDRLQWYVSQGGLVNSQKNREAIMNLVNTHPKLKDAQVSPELVDTTISILRGQNALEWRTLEPTPPPTPEPAPVRMIETKDGPRPELPLNASEVEMRAANIEQLRDLSRRKGEGTSWRKGWHGANVGGRQSQVI
jgi:hypothetical protein